MKNTAILGASHKPDRYAYKALKMLAEYNHETHLIHPSYKKIEDYDVFPNLIALKDSHNDIHTLTVYVNPKILESYFDDILYLAPKRIILNPGTEHPQLQDKFTENNIEVVIGCTLVMLRTNQF
jgi:predicted CoA-binding protein